MKVILQKDVPNLGDAGEIKQVAAGYARNYLIPKNLVILAQSGSTKALEHQNKLIALKSERRTQDMQAVADKLKTVGKLNIEARVGGNGKMFGSVTAITIAQALVDKGFAIDKRKIDLADKIKTTGSFTVKVRLAEKIEVSVDIEVVSIEVVEEEHIDEFAEEAKANEAALKRQKEREESREKEDSQSDKKAEPAATEEAEEAEEA